jgi:hypothetical protein
MNEFQPQGGSGRTAGRRHEARDFNVRAAALFGLGLLVAAVVIHLVTVQLLGAFGRRARALDLPPRPVTAEPPAPSTPLLQTSPSEDLERLRAAEAAALGTYGWIDRERGRVRLPIDRAVELLLQQGLPARETPP